MEKADPFDNGFLLPDLCAAQAVLFLILVALLLALTPALFAQSWHGLDWIAFGKSAIFTLGTMMVSAAVLYLARQRIMS